MLEQDDFEFLRVELDEPEALEAEAGWLPVTEQREFSVVAEPEEEEPVAGEFSLEAGQDWGGLGGISGREMEPLPGSPEAAWLVDPKAGPEGALLDHAEWLERQGWWGKEKIREYLEFFPPEEREEEWMRLMNRYAVGGLLGLDPQTVNEDFATSLGWLADREGGELRQIQSHEEKKVHEALKKILASQREVRESILGADDPADPDAEAKNEASLVRWMEEMALKGLRADHAFWGWFTEREKKGLPELPRGQRGSYEVIANRAYQRKAEVVAKVQPVARRIWDKIDQLRKAPGGFSPNIDRAELFALPPDLSLEEAGLVFRYVEKLAGGSAAWNRLRQQMGESNFEGELDAARAVYDVLGGKAEEFEGRLAGAQAVRESFERGYARELERAQARLREYRESGKNDRGTLRALEKNVAHFKARSSGPVPDAKLLEKLEEAKRLGLVDKKIVAERLRDLAKMDFERGQHDAAVLSNGVVVVRPMLAFDAAAWAKAVNESGATPEAKARAMAERMGIRDELGSELYRFLLASETFQHWLNGSPERVLSYGAPHYPMEPVRIPATPGQADRFTASPGELVERFRKEMGPGTEAYMQIAESGAASAMHGTNKQIFGALAYIGLPYTEELAKDAAQSQEQAAGIAEGLGGATWQNKVASLVVGAMPAVASGGALGFRGMMLAGGALEAGGTFIDARRAGYGPGQSRRLGLLAAVPDVVITKLTGPIGVEAMAATEVGKRGFRNWAKGMLMGAGNDTAQNVLTIYAQEPVRSAIDPNYDVDAAAREASLYSWIAGSGMQTLRSLSGPRPLVSSRRRAQAADELSKMLATPEQIVAASRRPDGKLVISVDDLVAASPTLKSASLDEGLEIAEHLRKNVAVAARDKVLEHLLKQPISGNGHVVILAGGPGSGKSSSLRRTGTAEFIYDTVFGDLQAAEALMDKILATGRTVEIKFVLRDPVNAMRGNLARVVKEKRVVPAGPLAEMHVGAREVIKALGDKYGNSPRVWFDLSRTVEGGESVSIKLDEISSLDLAETTRKVNNLINEIEAGRDVEWKAAPPAARAFAAARGHLR